MLAKIESVNLLTVASAPGHLVLGNLTFELKVAETAGRYVEVSAIDDKTRRITVVGHIEAAGMVSIRDWFGNVARSM